MDGLQQLDATCSVSSTTHMAAVPTPTLLSGAAFDDDTLPDGDSAAAAARRMPANCRC